MRGVIVFAIVLAIGWVVATKSGALEDASFSMPNLGGAHRVMHR